MNTNKRDLELERMTNWIKQAGEDEISLAHEVIAFTKQLADKYGDKTGEFLARFGALLDTADDNKSISKHGGIYKDNRFAELQRALRRDEEVGANTVESLFPVGTVIPDYMFSPDEKNNYVVDEPMIIVGYTNISTTDLVTKRAAILMRKNALLSPIGLMSGASAKEWLDSSMPHGYYDLCSTELKSVINYFVRAEVKSVDGKIISMHPVAYEPRRFFTPSPRNLGFNVTEDNNSHASSTDVALDDLSTWEYFTLRHAKNDQTLILRKLGFVGAKTAVTYHTRLRTVDSKDDGYRYVVDTAGEIMLNAAKTEAAVRPACYIF